jgi:hypothetical protein
MIDEISIALLFHISATLHQTELQVNRPVNAAGAGAKTIPGRTLTPGLILKNKLAALARRSNFSGRCIQAFKYRCCLTILK